MPTYRYQAVTRQGETRTGAMTGATIDEVVANLQKTGLIPISVELPSSTPPVRSLAKVRLGGDRVRRRDITAFTKQLATLVGAGLPIDRALGIVRQTASTAAVATLIEALQAAVRGGESLSTALKAQPQHFSEFYINFVRAAEVSGSFAVSLDELASYLEKAQALRERLLSAMIYPLLLVFVTLLALTIIMVFVLPEFAQLFEDMDAPLPAPTAFVMGVSNAVRHYGLYVLAGIAVLVLYVRGKADDHVWRKNWDRRFLALGLVGDLIRKIEMARLSRSLGTLLKGGVPLLAAIKIARNGLSNRVLIEHIEQVTGRLQEGSSLAGPLQDSGVFPDFAVQMIQIGEETGELDAMLVRVADSYDDDVATTAQRLLAVLEPAMIITLGVVIGGIIMSILVAIMGVNELPG
ncbi:MAG: type II secretion system F family protein [Gammaproteobacteria bacterium]|nr:type II secretion system F family protein [Gammaproteobacteria bacterium]